MSLSSEDYINELKENYKRRMYEDNKSNSLFAISDDLINMIFTKLEFHLLDDMRYKSLDDHVEPEFKKYKQIMAILVHIFNESNYLDESTADYLTKLCNTNSSYSCISGTISDSMHVSNISSTAVSLQNPPLLVLLLWFSLIYEIKFIYGDINSKFYNLNIRDYF
ncbi:hypothetical protein RF11_12617 [Thelohanellus kitauei]|uniref:Uncharacterized protein n=1 Tax=Thelohanellus kitauei TaxID=669202 RepID=A0A0C2MBW8_THEKT|nr:hypothetical protein RF11_12617 [Thelohanellus kitauei]